VTKRQALDFTELKIQMVNSRGGRCEVCDALIGPVNAQIAHRIPQSKMNLKKYGKAVIHHRFNLAVTCGLECNGRVVVHGKTEERLVERIQQDLSQGALF